MDPELRRRLARFDRAARVPARAPQRSGRDPLRSLRAAGAIWCGSAPTGFMRLERDLGIGPHDDVAREVEPGLPAGDLCVLDTETTGLESGTGTLVFMVGLVHWSGRSRRLVQLFLPEPAGERAFLAAVVAELSSVGALVSYNGRGFDVPRLRSRLRIHRLDDGSLEMPHLDLLYPVRRMVRGWLPDARLKTVEEALLGAGREGDLPGEFAPEVYRALQFENRDAGLAAVLKHNARDVENLPHLVARLATVLAGSEFGGLHPGCALEAARTHLDRQQTGRALRALEHAIAAGDARVRGRARALRAQVFRRKGDFKRAAAEWETRIAESPSDLSARIELAKLLEHRLGERSRALALVVEARTLLELRTDCDPTLSEAVEHRYRRLVRRLRRTP